MWKTLVADRDPQRAFVQHFDPIATHADSHDLLGDIASRVVRFAIEQADPFDTHYDISGSVADRARYLEIARGSALE